MRERLIHIGLNEEEADLYLALLEIGSGPASKLAKRLGRNRSSIYHTLHKLENKGLALTSKREGYKVFSPAPPEAIIDLTRQRFEGASALLPELLSLHNTQSSKPHVKFLEGLPGIEDIFQQTLYAKEEIVGYTNIGLLVELFPDQFRRYLRERAKRKIKTRYLSPRTANDNETVFSFISTCMDSPFLELLFINPDQFPIASDITIWGKNTALMALSREEQFSLLIESESTAKTMKAVFDMAWVGASFFIAA